MIKNVSITITYFALDTSTGGGKTGDASNHTIKLVKDGTAATASNSPTEIDSTNAPGYYKLVLTQAETNFNTIAVTGKSSTSGIVIIGLLLVTDQSILPAGTTPGASGGFIVAGTGTNQFAPVSGGVDLQTIKGQAVTCAAGVTVGAFVGNATAALAVDASGRIDVGKILGTASAGAAGYVGLDWGHITGATTVVDFTNTTIKNLDGNTVQTGDSYARLGAPAGASVSADVAAINAKTTNLPAAPADESLVIAATTAIYNRIGAPAGASLSADVAAIQSDTTSLLAGVKVTDISAAGLAKFFTVDSTKTFGDAIAGSVVYEIASNASGGGSSYDPTIEGGTAQAGTSTTITLDSGASATDNLYVGTVLRIMSGTGAGQIRVIINYVGSTKLATVNRAFSPTPDNTSVYKVLAQAGVNTNANLNVTVANYETGMSPASQVLASPTQKVYTDPSGFVKVSGSTYNTLDQLAVHGDTAWVTTNLYLHSGTAQGGTSSTITLAAGASSDSNSYVGAIIGLYSTGTGTGQSARITAYDGASKIATIYGTWGTTPDNTSLYKIWAAAPGVVQVGTGEGQFNLSGGYVFVGGYAPGQDPATVVLDASASAFTAPGTIGGLIAAAASAGDPWVTDIPASYPVGTAGFIVGNILNELATMMVFSSIDGWQFTADALANSPTSSGPSAAAIWAYATRTLTALDPVTLAASQPNYAPAKAGDKMDLVDAPNATGLAAIAAGVWNALTTVASVNGSFGKYILQQLAILFPGAPIELMNPVDTDGLATITQGTAYLAANGRALVFAVPTTLAVLSSLDAVSLGLTRNSGINGGVPSALFPGIVVNPGDPDNQGVSFDLTAAETATLASDTQVPNGFTHGQYAYSYIILANLVDCTDLGEGQLSVRANAARCSS